MPAAAARPAPATAGRLAVQRQAARPFLRPQPRPASPAAISSCRAVWPAFFSAAARHQRRTWRATTCRADHPIRPSSTLLNVARKVTSKSPNHRRRQGKICASGLTVPESAHSQIVTGPGHRRDAAAPLLHYKAGNRGASPGGRRAIRSRLGQRPAKPPYPLSQWTPAQKHDCDGVAGSKRRACFAPPEFRAGSTVPWPRSPRQYPRRAGHVGASTRPKRSRFFKACR